MNLYETLNIRRDEVLPVSLFIFQSVFLGVFLGAFDVGANTLFLQAFDSSMISKAFAVSGFIGIGLTSLYSYFQGRVIFSRLSVYSLLGIFLITFILRFGYFFSDSKWLAFGLFVMMGPLNIVALVGFWGTVSRIFDLRQGKRIFGIIDTGQVFGVILSSWAVPFLVAGGFKTNNLLYISAVSIFIAFVIQIFINSSFPTQLKATVSKEQKVSRFIDTMKIPYVRTMAFFVILSMLVAFFVHFLFLAVAKTRFENSDELAKFLGGLMGTLTFVSILIKSFVYGTLMKNYGLKVTLLISPVIMALLTISAAAVGSLFGYTIESASFTFFFLLISLGKLFQKALKDSIESPSLKMIYQSLDPNIRYEVQARVDGTVNEIAALFSGIILTVFSIISFFRLNYYNYVLLIIIVIWAIITIYLYKGYHNTLQQTLLRKAGSEDKPRETDIILPDAGGEILAEQLSIVGKSKPWNLEGMIQSLLNNATGQNLPVLLSKIRELSKLSFIEPLENTILRVKDKVALDAVNETISYLKQVKSDSEDLIKIKGLINSKNFEDRVYAAKVIGASTSQEIKNNLTFLMRDLVPVVKKHALWAAQGSKSKEIISFLIDFLDKDQYAPLAHAALKESGQTGLEMLDLALQKTNVSDIFIERILRVIPETGSLNAPSVLFSKFSVKSLHRSIILEGLLKINFIPDEKERMALNQKLIEQAGICAWNLNVFYYCPAVSKIPFLKDELDIEVHKSIRFLFDILKIAYDKNSIEAVLENLEAGTGQSITFAVELVDTFIDEDIKPYIVPLLEDNSISNKIWSLENYFPLREYSTPEAVLKAVINRDSNLIGKQAKIFALNAFRHMENPDVSADLVSQLFNTDKILRQISAQIIEGIDRSQYLNCKKRLSDKLRVELDKQLNIFQLTGLSATDKISFFRSLFKGSTEDRDIIYLLYQSTAVKVNKSNLFELELFKDKAYILFIESGGATLFNGEEQFRSFTVGETINTLHKNKLPWRLITRDNTIIHYIEYDKVVSCVYDNDYLVKYIEMQKPVR
jgi:AAA family ATP:ADP antiporter